MFHNHIKALLEEDKRDHSAESVELKPLDYYLQKMNDLSREEKATKENSERMAIPPLPPTKQEEDP